MPTKKKTEPVQPVQQIATETLSDQFKKLKELGIQINALDKELTGIQMKKTNMVSDYKALESKLIFELQKQLKAELSVDFNVQVK